MTVFHSSVNPGSEDFARNRADMLASISTMREILDRAALLLPGPASLRQLLLCYLSVISSGVSFQYFFLDEELDTYYAEEKRTGAITMIFSILAIFIASLGLFGLTLYNSQKRIREIGIRKVVGSLKSQLILQLILYENCLRATSFIEQDCRSLICF